jgi:secondary thiamine-phosphate synthase enzyme
MIEIETRKSVEVVDLTPLVEAELKKSGVEAGICLVYTPHTTTGVIINEADPRLIQDILKLISDMAPEGAGYQHDRSDGNAHAHLRAVLLGNSASIPVEKNRLALGTWQRVLFFELDGPRQRRVFVKILADSN